MAWRDTMFKLARRNAMKYDITLQTLCLTTMKSCSWASFNSLLPKATEPFTILSLQKVTKTNGIWKKTHYF